MDAKYYLNLPGRTGWYSTRVSEHPPRTIKIPLMRMAAEYIDGPLAVVEDRPPVDVSDIELPLLYIEEWVSGYRLAVYR